jgi:hypothetical protein
VFSPDGKQLFSSGIDGIRVWVWQPALKLCFSAATAVADQFYSVQTVFDWQAPMVTVALAFGKRQDRQPTNNSGALESMVGNREGRFHK